MTILLRSEYLILLLFVLLNRSQCWRRDVCPCTYILVFGGTCEELLLRGHVCIAYGVFGIFVVVQISLQVLPYHFVLLVFGCGRLHPKLMQTNMQFLFIRGSVGFFFSLSRSPSSLSVNSRLICTATSLVDRTWRVDIIA